MLQYASKDAEICIHMEPGLKIGKTWRMFQRLCAFTAPLFVHRNRCPDWQRRSLAWEVGKLRPVGCWWKLVIQNSAMQYLWIYIRMHWKMCFVRWNTRSSALKYAQYHDNVRRMPVCYVFVYRLLCVDSVCWDMWRCDFRSSGDEKAGHEVTKSKQITKSQKVMKPAMNSIASPKTIQSMHSIQDYQMSKN